MYNFKKEILADWIQTQPLRWRSRLFFHYTRLPVGNIDGAWLDHLLDLQDNKCYVCEVELTFRSLQLDHVQPIKVGGGNTKNNILLACKGCNQRKGAKSIGKAFKDFVLPEYLQDIISSPVVGKKIKPRRKKRYPIKKEGSLEIQVIPLGESYLGRCEEDSVPWTDIHYPNPYAKGMKMPLEEFKKQK